MIKKNKITIYSYLFLLLIFFIFNAIRVDAYSFSEKSGLDGFGSSSVIKSEKTLDVSIGEIIQIGLSLVGVIFMVLLVYSGVLWMTAMGNDQQVEKAKKIMSESIIGLVVVVSAYAISLFIVGSFNFQ